MGYIGTALHDAMSVDEIYTVIKVDFEKKGVGKGERHDFPEMNFLSRGKHVGWLDDVEGAKNEGELTIIAPGSFHKSSGPSNSEGLIISFSSKSPALERLYNRKLKLTTEQQNTFRNIVELGLKLFRHRDPGSKVCGMILKKDADPISLCKMKKALELFLIDLLICYGTKTKREEKRNSDFDKVKIFLTEHISERLIVTEIAEGTKMSVSKLKLLFREKTGGGAVNYFIEMKIEKAKEFIRDGQMNFTEISESLGFNSLHYFSRLFKKTTGVSPTAYYEAHLKK